MFSGKLHHVATKVCTLKGVDLRGLPKSVTVVAQSLFEPAAQGFQNCTKRARAASMPWNSRCTNPERDFKSVLATLSNSSAAAGTARPLASRHSSVAS